jgi:hypothetical protein
MARVDTLIFSELMNALSFSSSSIMRGFVYEEIVDKMLRAIFVLAFSRSVSRPLTTPNVEIAQV